MSPTESSSEMEPPVGWIIVIQQLHCILLAGYGIMQKWYKAEHSVLLLVTHISGTPPSREFCSAPEIWCLDC